MHYEIIHLPGYRGIGMKWEGRYQEIGKLKDMIQAVKERAGELGHAAETAALLGLSYHTRPDGFAHYSGYEVKEEQPVPEGLLEFRIPAMTYLVTAHQKGEDVVSTYRNIGQWLQDSPFMPYTEPGVDYFDPLPIKHERYPSDQGSLDPHFEIRIPVIRRDNTD